MGGMLESEHKLCYAAAQPAPDSSLDPPPPDQEILGQWLKLKLKIDKCACQPPKPDMV